MTLDDYFSSLIEQVQASDKITNQGKDKEGFFLPTREVLLRNLNMLKDLHAKPLAKPMLRSAWAFVVENMPPEMLVLDPEQKVLLKKMLEA
jgi:hypothetical protein